MRTGSRGFSLLELMVSMAIGTIVLLLAVISLSSTGNEYGRNTDSVAAEREARAILTQIAEDMSKASGGSLEIEESGGVWRQDRIGFTCLQPPDAQAADEAVGDLCLVYYYVKDLRIGKETVRCLMRGFRSSDEVFGALRTEQLDTLYEEQTVDEPVAFGVIGFEAEGLIRQAGGDWKAWIEDPEDPFQIMPDAIRLKLVVARRELASKLRSSSDWDGHPLIGSPEDADRSRLLETYEITHPFGHAN